MIAGNKIWNVKAKLAGNNTFLAVDQSRELELRLG